MFSQFDSIKLFGTFRYIFQIFYHRLLGIPRIDEPIESTQLAIDRYERFTLFFRTLLYGFRQYGQGQKDDSTTSEFSVLNIFRSFDVKNWSIRFASAINFVRFVSLIFVKDEVILIYLGDNVFRSKDRVSICMLNLLSITVSMFAREAFLVIEARNHCTILSDYDYVRTRGFNASYLKMTQTQVKQFRATVHFLLNLYNRIIMCMVPFILILYNIPFFTNPHTYRIPSLALYGTLWSFSHTWSVVFLANEILTISGYLFLICTIHYYRITSVVEQSNAIPNQSYLIKSEALLSLNSKSDLIDKKEKQNTNKKTKQNFLNNRIDKWSKISYSSSAHAFSEILCNDLEVTAMHDYMCFQSTPNYDAILSWSTSLVYNWTYRFNVFEFDFKRIRYLVLYYFTVVAFMADLFIFLGIIVVAHSQLVANMYALLGGLVLVLSALACYFTGDFMTKLEVLHRRFHSICCEIKLPIHIKLKILEIMDRSLGPYNGIKVGDLATITQIFFISDFICMLSSLSRGSTSEKLRWIFNLYDINNDGFITKQELLTIVRAVYLMLGDFTKPLVGSSTVQVHVDKIFFQMDTNHDGVITFDEFSQWCLRDDNTSQNLTMFDTIFM